MLERASLHYLCIEAIRRHDGSKCTGGAGCAVPEVHLLCCEWVGFVAAGWKSCRAGSFDGEGSLALRVVAFRYALTLQLDTLRTQA